MMNYVGNSNKVKIDTTR